MYEIDRNSSTACASIHMMKPHEWVWANKRNDESYICDQHKISMFRDYGFFPCDDFAHLDVKFAGLKVALLVLVHLLLLKASWMKRNNHEMYHSLCRCHYAIAPLSVVVWVALPKSNVKDMRKRLFLHIKFAQFPSELLVLIAYNNTSTSYAKYLLLLLPHTTPWGGKHAK